MTKKQPTLIFIKRDSGEKHKLTLMVDGQIFDRVDEKFEMNYTYVMEQILDHVDKNGLEKVLKLKFVRPEKK